MRIGWRGIFGGGLGGRGWVAVGVLVGGGGWWEWIPAYAGMTVGVGWLMVGVLREGAHEGRPYGLGVVAEEGAYGLGWARWGFWLGG